MWHEVASLVGIGGKVPDSGTPSAKSEAEACLVYLKIKRGQEAGEGETNCYSLELHPAVHNRTHIYSALINKLLIVTIKKSLEAPWYHRETISFYFFLSIHFTLNLQYTERMFKMNDQCPFSSQPFKLEEGWSSKSYMATKLFPMKVISPFWEVINQISLTGHHGGLRTPLHSEKAMCDRWPIVVLRTVFPPSTAGFLQKKKCDENIYYVGNWRSVPQMSLKY